MSQVKVHEFPNGVPLASRAAAGAFTRIGPAKRFLIATVEALCYPVVKGLTLAGRPRASLSKEPRKILVVEYWNLGDIVILLPFLRGLRRAYPQAEITLAANSRVADILAGQDLVDHLRPVLVPWAQHFSRWKKYNPFSTRWWGLLREILALRRECFDLALSGRMDIRDNLLLWLTGSTRRIGYDVGGGGLFLTDVVQPDLRHPHRSRVWLRLLDHLARPAQDLLPRLRLGAEQLQFAADFLAANHVGDGELLVGVHPGARVPTRRWGGRNFAEVVARLKGEFPVRFLWFVDPSEELPVDFPTDLCVPVSLPFREFLAVLGQCRLLICNDSGPMHLATALGVPVVAVFGPQKPEWFGPLGDDNRIVMHPEFWCRPCFDYCIFDQPYCLRTISVDEVVSAATAGLRPFAALEGPPLPVIAKPVGGNSG